MKHPTATFRVLADDNGPDVATLANGVRAVVFRLPHLATAAVSVFVRSGSRHERARQNGISHVIEHMAFKGTNSRDCQQVNLDAERLGADVNAHTDKDHTALHMRGLARDAGTFVGMLGDIVRRSTFREAELERARNQIAVRRLGAQEVPAQLPEHAALDLFALGRVRPRDELLADIAAVTPLQVRGAFAQMLDAGAAVGLAGRIAGGEEERAAPLLARHATEA